MPGRPAFVIMITGVSPTQRIGTAMGMVVPLSPQQSIFVLKRHWSSAIFSTLTIS